MSNDTTYARTIRVPVATPTATKTGKLTRAMKEYRTARQEAIAYFAGEGDPLNFTYSDRETLRKAIAARDDVQLPSRVIYPALTTVAQNYAEYAKGTFDTPPTAERADTLGLEGQQARLFHTDGRYYLDVPTGRGPVALPLRTTDDEWHQERFPRPAAVPPRGRSRTGVPFAELEPEAFPGSTVKLSTSTLSKAGRRSFVANLVFQHRKRIERTPSDDPRYVVGVDRGRNVIASAAVYDRHEDHVHDWAQYDGDEVEHRMDEFADRVAEFQAAGVWEQMDDARERRIRYKRQVDFEAANLVVDLARGRFDVAIALEDLGSMTRLGGYAAESRRFTEWSYARLRDAIARRADEYDISVVAVEPANTSQVCSRCGSEATRRSGVHFTCQDCGYEQHADANAAVNIAKRAAGVGPLAAADDSRQAVSAT